MTTQILAKSESEQLKTKLKVPSLKKYDYKPINR